MPTLFTPLRVGALDLPNRVLMAPLTRNRAHPDGTPGPLAATYYAQRASAGLLITEATQISPEGKGYKDTPGIHADAHVTGWRSVTDAVHAAGGRIFLQMWHVGRVSHTSVQPGGQPPVAPSAITADTQTFVDAGFVATSAPRALETAEMPRIVADYAAAAERAKAAGFDGVEIHGANGYLIDQFLKDRSNQRTDAYGGAAENRIRLAVEVIEAVAKVWGADRVGLRLTPTAPVNDTWDSDPARVFGLLLDRLNPLGLAYLHLVEDLSGKGAKPEDRLILDGLRTRWSGVYLGNGGYDGPSAAAAVAEGRADAITFGKPFIANPDLPTRILHGSALNTPDKATFYGGDERGYIDYPALAA